MGGKGTKIKSSNISPKREPSSDKTVTIQNNNTEKNIHFVSVFSQFYLFRGVRMK